MNRDVSITWEGDMQLIPFGRQKKRGSMVLSPLLIMSTIMNEEKKKEARNASAVLEDLISTRSCRAT